jgi:hypothetical protein
VKPRVWIDSDPHGERRPRSFIASDMARRGLATLTALTFFSPDLLIEIPHL